MSAEQQTFRFAHVEGRKVEASFDGGKITSDAGALLLKQVNAEINMFGRAAAIFYDARLPAAVEHTLALQSPICRTANRQISESN